MVADLLEVARADTAHAELYQERARELAGAVLAETPGFGAEVASLMGRVRAAVDERDWQRLGEAAGAVSDLLRMRSERGLYRIADRADPGAALVDPFSPGTSGLAGVPERELPALRDATVERLEALRAADPAWAGWYAARRDALRALRGLGDAAAALPASPDALVLSRPFSRDTCDRAARLDLVPHRLPSTFDEISARFRPTWGVAPGQPPGEAVRLSVTIPADAEAALRQNLEAFTRRIVLTSAGTRYLPPCGEEDLLVEVFDEPSPATTQPPAPSPLLVALGLPRRSGLPRSAIERALRARGEAVVTDLGLDPREFRVVCVPADVYTRLGARLGWGRQALWTHFDGHLVSADRKLMPLAGGDVRYGGLHDIVAVGAGYDSDRLIARLAVVQRRRFATW
jgi:hypothetical protein